MPTIAHRSSRLHALLTLLAYAHAHSHSREWIGAIANLLQKEASAHG
jgi:hypothetical protein